jgi:hypothetical protein
MARDDYRADWSPGDTDQELSKADRAFYRNLLVALNVLLLRCHEVREAHAGCPGCFLCAQARGAGFTVDGYASLLDCEAPIEVGCAAEAELAGVPLRKYLRDKGISLDGAADARRAVRELTARFMARPKGEPCRTH